MKCYVDWDESYRGFNLVFERNEKLIGMRVQGELTENKFKRAKKESFHEFLRKEIERYEPKRLQ